MTSASFVNRFLHNWLHVVHQKQKVVTPVLKHGKQPGEDQGHPN
ncbi:hypothetical protein SLEP1_g46170 [Rubroshorea leprosula]|uniref:Uncharacterized protein n=1 Tax=Rubroshorea leprosula TaxID=152421 RepID=A0AAV5LM89_9ROSI|nr:hypothetical protein SLEP1_g46170 [Rubroshorea leprosula]